MTGHELAASLSVTVMRGRAITLKMKAFTVTFALIVVILFVVAFATLMVIFSPIPALAPDVMFIRIAMTFDAVPEITNPLLDVLTPDVLGGMLVTAITGVLRIVVALVTGHALDVVVAV